MKLLEKEKWIVMARNNKIKNFPFEKAKKTGKGSKVWLFNLALFIVD